MILERHVGPHFIRLESFFVGKDLMVIISGGDTPHVGSISLGFVSKSPFRESTTRSVSTISLPGHKDYVLSSSIAERILHELNCSVVVSVGIHVDNAKRTDIDSIIEATDELVSEFLKTI